MYVKEGRVWTAEGGTWDSSEGTDQPARKYETETKKSGAL